MHYKIFDVDEPDNENGNIVYVDVFDNDIEIGSFSVGPGLYQDGTEIKWTGNAELSYRFPRSEEFDLIIVRSGFVKGNDEENMVLAIQMIKDHLTSAIEMYDQNIVDQEL